MALAESSILAKYNELISSLEIASARDILALFHPDVNAGSITLHKWQSDELLRTGQPVSAQKPLRTAIVAPNGSGKSQFIVAPWAVFEVLAFDESETVVTNASGAQLDKQAGRFIKMLCHRVNNFFRENLGFDGDVFDIQVRKIENNFNGSYIDLFATDEAGKAEGWHPVKPGGRFTIIVDEAKSVSEEIYEALDRCNGFTSLLYISSPGASKRGTFYRACSDESLGFHVYKVKAGESTHLNPENIALLIKKYGINHPFIRSSVFAEFVSTDEQLVINRELILASQELFDDRPSRHFGKRRAGLDLSAGGDEQVLSIWEGCFQIAEFTWHITNAAILRDLVIDTLREWKVDASQVWMDDGGMGRTYGDMFAEKGWNFNRVLNQATAFDSTRYANRGTELWYNLKRYIEESLIKFLPSPGSNTLIDQLSSRYYKLQPSNKIILESKRDAKLKGHGSPDRADAAALAWAGLVWPIAELELAEDLAKDSASGGASAIKPKTEDDMYSWYERYRTERAGAALANKGNDDGSKANLDAHGNYKKTSEFTLNLREIMEKTSKLNTETLQYAGISTLIHK